WPAARARRLATGRTIVIRPWLFGTTGNRRLHVEDHALTILSRIDRQDGCSRDIEAVRHATEASLEADRLVVHVQMPHGTGRGIEHDLTVIGEARRHLHPWVLGIDQQVRRAIVIDDPFVQGADQIGTTGIHGFLLLSASRARQRKGWPGRPPGRTGAPCSRAAVWPDAAIRPPEPEDAREWAIDSNPPDSAPR